MCVYTTCMIFVNLCRQFFFLFWEVGPGIQETHAALVRSNFPMRPQCGIFYYEMKVLSKGDDGFIGIGFCCSSNKLERLPGKIYMHIR